jgi:hypothetical protein
MLKTHHQQFTLQEFYYNTMDSEKLSMLLIRNQTNINSILLTDFSNNNTKGYIKHEIYIVRSMKHSKRRRYTTPENLPDRISYKA